MRHTARGTPVPARPRAGLPRAMACRGCLRGPPAVVARVGGRGAGGGLRRTRRCGARAASASAAEGDAAGGGAPQRGVSWTEGRVGLYYTKRKDHKTDELGNIPEESYKDVVEPVGWDASAKRRLACQAVGAELGLEESQVSSRIDSLLALVPSLESALDVMKVADLARLAVASNDVAARLVALKTTFPTADVQTMVGHAPQLLLVDAGELAAAAERLQALLPGLDVGAAASVQPMLLRLRAPDKFVEDAKRLLPGKDVAKMLQKDPNLVLRLQTGEDLIPYDNGTAAQIAASLALRARGESGSDGVGSEAGW